LRVLFAIFGKEERALPAKRAFFVRKRTLSQGAASTRPKTEPRASAAPDARRSKWIA
jgi:hypothetical protein